MPTAVQIPELVATYRHAGLEVGYETVGDLASVDPAVGLTGYRVAQEALANAAKHMPYGRTCVRLGFTDEVLDLDVTSHGPAGSPPPTERSLQGHYGLTGMRERAEVVGASLFAGPSQEGWTVRLTVPQAARAATGGGSAEVVDR